jgi:hypothetical protein
MTTAQVHPSHRPSQSLRILALLGIAAITAAPVPLFAASPDANQAAAAATLAPPPDSSPAPRDPFLSPPPGALPDTGAAPLDMPPQEAVRLSTQGAFSLPAPRVGDSLDYVVQVEWEDTQVPVFVLAPDSVDFPGFKVMGQATVHKKLAAGQSVRNHTEFVFRLQAQTQGPGKAASMKLRYLTGLSRQEEAVFIPTAHIDILPAPVRLLDMLWFKILLSLLALGAAGAAGMASFKIASRKRAEKSPKREDLKPAVLSLKSRLRSAQNSPDAGKEILLEMEALSVRFLRNELEAAGQTPVQAKSKSPGDPAAGAAPAAPARFEPLLDAYLRLVPATGTNAGAAGGTALDWAKLKDLFRHARFAGGHKEPHELQDAFRTFAKCLKITGEDQHE